MIIFFVQLFMQFVQPVAEVCPLLVFLKITQNRVDFFFEILVLFGVLYVVLKFASLHHKSDRIIILLSHTI